MHVDRLETRASERGGHLDFAVYALFAQDGDGRTGAEIFRDATVEGDLRRDPRIFRIDAELMLGLGARRIVTERGNAARDVGPNGPEGEKIFLEDGFAATRDFEGRGCG